MCYIAFYMATRQTMTISLPPEMISQVERVRKAEQRTRSELVREALRTYFAKRIASAEPSSEELALIRRGRSEIAAGKHVSLDRIINELEGRPRRLRRKTT